MTDPFQTPSAGQAAPSGVPDSGSAAPLRVLGDFVLLREVGRGGMGTVYEARQQSLQRSVAVKVLSQQVSASPTAVLRFQREAQAAAKLHHAHIVPIFGLGENAGVYYYAMEFIDGYGLNTLIRPEAEPAPTTRTVADPAETVLLARSGGHAPPSASGVSDDPAAAPTSSASRLPDALPPIVDSRFAKKQFEMIATHIATIADALDYAHREGVVHRDVKPHNLILGKDGKMRISDFGLARLSEQPGVTVTGELIGSPLYMSPEQIMGAASKVDHRTDIYSLGATLYEWLAGTPPYPGETREQVISRILTTEPPALRTHNAGIPLDLETVCLKAIDRDPQRRYQSAGEFRDDLRRFVENRPIKARRASLATRLRKFVGRHQVASLGSAAVLVAVLLATALFSSKREVKTQTANAIKATEESEKIIDAVKSLWGTDQLAGLLPIEIGAPLRMAQAAAPMVRDVVDPTSKSGGVPQPAAAQPAGADPAAVGTPAGIARRAARDFYLSTVDLSAAPPMADASSDPCAAVLADAGKLWDMPADDALAKADRCIAAQPDHVAARELRAALYGWFRKPEPMKAEAGEVIRLRPDGPRAYAWLGLSRLLGNEADAALADLTQALDRDAKSAWVKALSGLALEWMGHSFEAINLFDDALDTEPDLIVALLGRASARADLGNYSGAASDLDRVIEVEPENADTWALRGDHEVQTKDFEAAVRDYDQAIAIGGRTPSLSLRSLLARTKLRDAGKADSVPPAAPTRIENDNAATPSGDARVRRPSDLLPPPEARSADALRGRRPQAYAVRWFSLR